jgi:hypothetical protein
MKINVIFLAVSIFSSALGMMRPPSIAPVHVLPFRIPQNRFSSKLPSADIVNTQVKKPDQLIAPGLSGIVIKTCVYKCKNRKQCHEKIEKTVNEINFVIRKMDRGTAPWAANSDAHDAIERYAGCEDNRRLAKIYLANTAYHDDFPDQNENEQS